MRVVVLMMGAAIATLMATSGQGLAQTPNQAGSGRYTQNNLGPTGCDILIQAPGKGGAQRAVHFDEGQRQFVAGQMVACRDGKIVDAYAPPPRPAPATPSP